jgi:peptidoglycan hydrolase-like protein with peptidoglycan-binding domain
MVVDRPLADWPPAAAGLPEDPGSKAGEPAAGGGATAVSDATKPAQTAEPTGVGPSPEAHAGDAPLPPGPPPAPFKASVAKVRWLQSALMVENHNPGPIDGALGPQTMAAVDSWRRENDGAEALGAPLAEEEFQAILKAFGERFDQVQPTARSF